MLVVEDEPALQTLCRIHLEGEGCRVLEALTLEEAARALRTTPVDVILLDLHVGGGDGRRFLCDLRRRGAETPVALFTGGCDVDDELVQLAGALLPKPFGLEELAAVVRRLSPPRRACAAESAPGAPPR